MKSTKSINLRIAMIPFEDKTGFTAFFAEIPQIIVQDNTRDGAIKKLKEAALEFSDIINEFHSPEFELTQESIELVA